MAYNSLLDCHQFKRKALTTVTTTFIIPQRVADEGTKHTDYHEKNVSSLGKWISAFNVELLQATISKCFF